VPHDGEDYIHRIGRTARAATKGTAYTFINEKDQQKFKKIEQLLGKPVPKGEIPEQFGAAPEISEGSAPKKKKKKRNFKKKE
jgi:superfamily II DNA/RNA helicase